MSESPGNPEPLADLLARCRAGDRAAIDTLIRRFHPFASNLATSLVHRPDQADDVVQSSFVAVLTHLPALRAPEAFPGWLRQIIRSQYARLARDRRPGHIDDNHVSPGANPVKAAADNELRHLVRHAIRNLPPAQRQTAELFYLDELPQSDIARTLAIPEGTVKRRLHDARNSLRTTLRSQFPI